MGETLGGGPSSVHRGEAWLLAALRTRHLSSPVKVTGLGPVAAQPGPVP